MIGAMMAGIDETHAIQTGVMTIAVIEGLRKAKSQVKISQKNLESLGT
jgi:hypothetical protein